MPEASFVINLIKYLGFPAVLFLMWYMDHQSKEKHLNTLIDLLKDQVDSARDLIEVTRYHGAVLVRLEQKIDTNQQCPIVRGEVGGK